MDITNLDFSKIFANASNNEDDFVDIFIESKVSTLLSNEGKRLEKAISGIIQGAGIRLISNKKTYYAYTNNLDEKNLMQIGKSLKEAAYYDRNGTYKIAALNFNEKKPKTHFQILKDVAETSTSEKLKKIEPVVKFAWDFDKRAVQVNITYSDYKQDVIIVNSLGDFVKDFRENLAFLAHVVVSNGKKTEVGYEVAGGFTGFEFFDNVDPEDIAKKALNRAITQLDAPFAPSGTMPVVLSSEAGGTMIHEAIGHGLEADIAGNGLSVYSDKIGEQVASKLITVIDDSSLAGKRGFYRFDDEGTFSNKNVLVEDGILKQYMSDRLSNIKYGYELTGNGRRQSYEHHPIVRMSNTIIAPGKSMPEDIIKSVEDGIFVKKMGGGQVNTVTGDFVFDVMEGYIIKNGAVGEAVSGATLMGNGPEVLRNIDMVGNDLGFGIGTCGKDGQGVPVSDAQPTLRIPQIVVGGKSNG
ncbi:MAG: TldD/PmbA family protein [Deltaproteobacteria bacterium]|jgi:TldD protein|nr:TldD/PmbA family protein [Deltaproteobacteria bacterium]MCL5879837.1 TldD/PmbA family protein [Deltaproteobacteria bacterium]MDA8303880.1 TldD/PmbA family protein [Deltaproteobacteria bacterium]